MSSPNEFNLTTRIVSGRNAAAQIGDIAASLNVKKVQIITDKGVSGSGILDNIRFDLSPFKVVAGAGLRKCCYKVGTDFLEHHGIVDYVASEDRGLFFDSVSFAKSKLKNSGLKENNFYDLNLCSFCSGDDFHSYRRDLTAKRTLSFIAN